MKNADCTRCGRTVLAEGMTAVARTAVDTTGHTDLADGTLIGTLCGPCTLALLDWVRTG